MTYMLPGAGEADKDGKNTDAGRGTWLEPMSTWFSNSVVKKHEAGSTHAMAVMRQHDAPKQLIQHAVESSSALAAQQSETAKRKRTEREEIVDAAAFEQKAALVRTVIKMAYKAEAFSSVSINIELQAANAAKTVKPGTYGSHDSKDSARELTVYLADMDKKEVREAVRKSTAWTFCADGSSDRSMAHCVAVLVMWIDAEGRVWCALWEIVDCDGDAASQYTMLSKPSCSIHVSSFSYPFFLTCIYSLVFDHRERVCQF